MNRRHRRYSMAFENANIFEVIKMFIFDRPIAAALAALATSFVFVLVGILLEHVVK